MEIHKNFEFFYEKSIEIGNISQASVLLSNSKKIKKMKHDISPKSEKKSRSLKMEEKKYETFDSSTKKRILLDLKRNVKEIKNLKENAEELSNYELCQILEEINLESYNRILQTVLSKHLGELTINSAVLTHWRRKIKRWYQSADKPENRGKFLIPHHMVVQFRKKVIEILGEMKTRSFSKLQQKVLAILEEEEFTYMTNQEEKMNKKMCSKHWWFNFLQKNPDIKIKWENLRKERTKRHESFEIEEEEIFASSISTDQQTISSSPDSQIKMEDSINNNSNIIMEQELSPIFGSPLGNHPNNDAICKKEEDQQFSLAINNPLKQNRIEKPNQTKIPMQTNPPLNIPPTHIFQAQTPVLPFVFASNFVNPIQILFERQKMINMLLLQNQKNYYT